MIKIYAISIPRYKIRNQYIKNELASKSKLPWSIVGVDAVELRKESKTTWSHNPSLRDSEVGCALSHAKACKQLALDGAGYALIIEDDVSLPKDIDKILIQLSKAIKEGEVISLYNRTLLPEKFSILEPTEVDTRKLIYPMETRFMRTAAAYFLSQETASRIAQFNIPVQVVADNWARYYQTQTIDGIRLLHPIPISLKPFESTLSFDRGNGLQKLTRKILNSPILRKARAIRRTYIEKKREKHLILVNLPSDQTRVHNNK